MATQAGQQHLQAYTDYEALFSRGFLAIQQISLSCSQLINSGLEDEQRKAVQGILDAIQACIWPLDRVRQFFVEGENDAKGGKRRKTVSLQQLVSQVEHERKLLQKFHDEKTKGWALLSMIASREKKQVKVDALIEELHLSLRRVKSFAQAFVLEHGLKVTDLDKSKKADAPSYQLFCEQSPTPKKLRSSEQLLPPKKPAAPTPSPAQGAAQKGADSCHNHNCGAEYVPGANFCHMCGAARAAAEIS